jgi:hypothetical protein
VANPALERILRESGDGLLLETLSDTLSPSDLRSLLLEVARRRASEVTPASLLQRFLADRFVVPSELSGRDLHRVEAAFFQVLPDSYDAVVLSPLAPLGSATSVATIDQNRIVSTMRGTEVVADATNVLALEAARRRRASHQGESGNPEVFLATLQRQVRAQSLSGPRTFAHFGLAALVAAGRGEPGFRFESRALLEHLVVLHDFIRVAQPTWMVRVTLSDFGAGVSDLVDLVATPLRLRCPAVEVVLDPTRERARGYYRDACFLIHGIADGDPIELADGGCTDWTAQLLSDRTERLVIAGLGIDRLAGA